MSYKTSHSKVGAPKNKLPRDKKDILQEPAPQKNQEELRAFSKSLTYVPVGSKELIQIVNNLFDHNDSLNQIRQEIHEKDEEIHKLYITERRVPGNVGFSKVRLNDFKLYLKSFSRYGNLNTAKENQSGFVKQKQRKAFKTVRVDNNNNIAPRFLERKYKGTYWNRSVDTTESKILEEIAVHLETLPEHKRVGCITLFTQRAVCQSCDGVIQQFCEKYPNMKIAVYNGRGGVHVVKNKEIKPLVGEIGKIKPRNIRLK